MNRIGYGFMELIKKKRDRKRGEPDKLSNKKKNRI